MLNTARASFAAFAVCAALALFATPAAAQVSLTSLNTPSTQNFDTLASSGGPIAWTDNTTLPGWYAQFSAVPANPTTYAVGTGSSNTGALYSFGVAGTNPLTERALGSVASGTPGTIFYAVRLTNNTGATITSLDVSFVGEQWRAGGCAPTPCTPVAQKLDFQYQVVAAGVITDANTPSTGWTDVDSLDFTSPTPGTSTASALDGNAAANRAAKSGTIAVTVNPGQEIWIRWMDVNDPNNDHGLAVDDFSATPHGTVITTPALSIDDVTLAEGSSGTTNFVFTVSLSSPANAGGVTFDIQTADGTATAAGGDYTAVALTGQVIPQGFSSYTFTVPVAGDLAVESNETFFVNVTNVSGATVSDAQGLGTITNDDFSTIAIHDIQGSGSTSPLVGQIVTTTGVVTGVKHTNGNGFYLQTPDADADSNPSTSEGIFVFTSSAPPAAAAVGNIVVVQGKVSEFVPSSDQFSPPTTEIAGGPTVTLVSSGNPLPAAILLTAADLDPAGPIDQLEKYEGMRVQLNAVTSVAPTDGTKSEANATSTSTGMFFAVLPGVSRPFREPGIEKPEPIPAGAPATIPMFDANPERIGVDTGALVGSVPLDVTTGVTVTNVVGPLDFHSRTYTVVTDPASPPVQTTPNMQRASVRASTGDEFTVASFNMERFYDTTNDPATSDVTLTTTAFNNRLNKASLAIRNVLLSPDIIGIEEMENLATLQAVANKVNADAVAAGDPNPNYQAYLQEGNDSGGIDVGFLVKGARVTVVDVTQFGLTATYTPPGGGSATLNDRPPLVLRALINAPPHDPYPVTVIVNHLRSLLSINDPTDGERVRTKRRAQAEFLANLIQSRQASDPTERIISVGDYNAFQFNDGYVDVIGTIKGTPTPASQVAAASSDLVNPDLADLVDGVPAANRYSYSFEGNAQEIDHVIVTTGPQNALTATDLQYGRIDADFPEVYRSDATRPERISDHDPIVAYFSLLRPPVCSTATASTPPIYPLNHGMRSVAINNVTDPDHDPVTITVTAICQDEAPNFENIPAYAIDGTGVNSSSASVRAEFSGTRAQPSNGRVYHIYFKADDGRGGMCTGEVKVGVPTSPTGTAIDGGPLYDSTVSNGAACVVPGSGGGPASN